MRESPKPGVLAHAEDASWAGVPESRNRFRGSAETGGGARESTTERTSCCLDGSVPRPRQRLHQAHDPQAEAAVQLPAVQTLGGDALKTNSIVTAGFRVNF